MLVNDSAQSFLRPRSRAASPARALLLGFGFALLTALGAQVRIPVPWTDVPMTLQALAIVLAGMLLSPAAAASAMILYAGAGLAGLPVFAAGSPGILGPTGGYIVGFIIGAWLTAQLRGGAQAGFVRLSVAGLAGMGCVLGCGVLWRTFFFGGGFLWAVSSGLLPFAAKALLEVLLAAAIAQRVKRTFGGSRPAGRLST